MIDNFIFLLYLVSFAIGTASFAFALLYHLQERASWFVYYLVFLFLFGLLLVIYTMGIYQFIIINVNYTSIFNTLLQFALILAVSSLLYIVPLFLFHAVAFKQRVFKIILSSVTSSLYFIFSVINIVSYLEIFSIMSVLVLLTALLINIIIGMKYLSNVEDNILRNCILILGIITIMFIPIFIFDAIFSFTNLNIGINIMNLTVPVFYLWWNTVMLGYFFWYFVRLYGIHGMTKLSKSAKTTTDIRAKELSLTKRETEIVSYILKGLSNKDIAKSLHISLNTVNNHVANIYEKTNVKNRIELANIIRQ